MNFTCPYCQHKQTVTNARFDHGSFQLNVGDTAIGKFGISGRAICCANEDCLQVTATVSIRPSIKEPLVDQKFIKDASPIVTKQLIPESAAKVQPDYIPAPIVEDYVEACKIRDLSPKAAATLARRCLQGMIRDFCGISKVTLYQEISELRGQVDNGNAPQGVSEESIEAIDHIRQIGNIGAHMEKDINLIVDVAPHEAQVLIELIETLFDEWYIARQKRQQRFDKVKAIANEKAAQKKLSGTNGQT